MLGAGLCNHARKTEAAKSTLTDCEREVSTDIFTELVLYIEEMRLYEKTAPVSKMVDLARLHT